MKSGKCPKCSSTDIYYYGETVGKLPDAQWVRGYTYICFSCSYMEQYLDLTDKIKKKLIKFNQQEKRKVVFRIDEVEG